MDYAEQQRLIQQNNGRVQGNDAYAQSFINEEREADERRAAAMEAEADRLRQERQDRAAADFSARSAARPRWFGGSRRSRKSKRSKKSKKSKKSRR